MANVDTIEKWVQKVAHPVAPCTAYYVTNSDVLRARAFCSASSVILTISGMILTTSGDYIPFSFTLAPTSDRAETAANYLLTEGWLLHCTVRVSSGTARRGECFLKVGIQRGEVAEAVLHSLLISNYVSNVDDVTYPGSKLISSLEGPGIRKIVAVSTPATGSDWTTTVPTNAVWLIRGGGGKYTASAAAANRTPSLEISDGTSTHQFGGFAQSITANSTALLGFIPGGNTGLQSNARGHLTLPVDERARGGWTISSNTYLIATADTWTNVSLNVEEHLEE